MAEIGPFTQPIFVEERYQQKRNILDYFRLIGFLLLTIGLVALIIFCFWAYVFPFIPIIIVAWIYFGYRLFISTKREYELILTNDQLDIDMIHGKKRRKRLFTINCREVQSFFQKNNQSEYDTKTKGCTSFDCSKLPDDPLNKVIIWMEKGRPSSVIITPSEEMTRQIEKYIPQSARS